METTKTTVETPSRQRISRLGITEFDLAQEDAKEAKGTITTIKDFIIQVKENPKFPEANRKFALWDTSNNLDTVRYWVTDTAESLRYLFPGQLRGNPRLIGCKAVCKIDYEDLKLVPISEGEWSRLPPLERARVEVEDSPMPFFLEIPLLNKDPSMLFSIAQNFTHAWVAVVKYRKEHPAQKNPIARRKE